MKKSILIILSQMAFLIMNCLGQNKEQSTFYLSNYTFSKMENEIGQVKLNPNIETEIESITIEGENARLFKIDKNHKLSILKSKTPSNTKWLDVIVKAKTSKGELTDTFRIVMDEFIRNKVIAHRGAWKNTGVPENSIAALQHAIAMGCEGSEFDVHMSADAVPYINHDPEIQNVSIAKSMSDDLTKIKLTNGESLPTLESYLKAGIQQNKTKLILEIKASELGKESSIALSHQVVDLVEKLKAQAWVDYISFDYDVCKEVMKMAPYANVAYLNGDKTPTELAQDNFFGLDYHYGVLQKNPDWIKEAKQKNLTINIWTVNDQSLMETFLKQDVDFITTNEPEMLLKLVEDK